MRFVLSSVTEMTSGPTPGCGESCQFMVLRETPASSRSLLLTVLVHLVWTYVLGEESLNVVASGEVLLTAPKKP